MSSQWPSESGSDEGYGSTFSETTKQQIRALYRDRCAICLDHLPPGGGHFAHLIASSEEGEKTVQGGDFLGIIHPDYDRSSKDNGYPLCTNCHLGYFKPKLVTLSPPWPILKYILESLHQPGNSRSIYQICQSLIQSSRDHLSAPEDVKGLIPYLGLYSLVILRPEKVQECVIMTCKLPPLSILNNHQFVPALSDVDLSIPGVARIFDTSAITSTLPLSLGYIPLTDSLRNFVRDAIGAFRCRWKPC
ncbi:hypothetical protein BD410DRAFT_360186 [Rickenella mellea]|uniref:Uncharacterized protein n=1 Tax=Rickenella mellea TaxID=50990 RepID=A0A4Y7Q0J3_9AGAM|nr:hypothetical protein BD410DRAFT_360186 [Rickenella mellea]